MNTYVAIWHGAQIEIQSDTLYHAKLEAIRQFKPSKKQESLISVTLVAKNGEPVTHSITGL